MSKRKKHNTKLWVFLFLLFSIATTYYLVFETDILTVQEIVFNEDERVSEQSLLRYSKISYGESLLFMNEQIVANDLVKHPLIKEVTVSKNFPNKVNIEAVYRMPYFSIEHAGVYLTLDEDMVVIEMSDSRPEGYCIEGFTFDNYVKGKEIRLPKKTSLANGLETIRALKKIDAEFDINQTITFDDSEEGLGFVFLVGDLLKITIGDGNNANVRVGQLVETLRGLENAEKNSQLLVYSLDEEHISVDFFYSEQKGK